VGEYFAAPNGPALLSVSEQVDTRTAGGRLVLNVLGAVSQWEREAIGERTATAMRHMSERGEYVGGKPRFGYRLSQDGRLAPHEAEQAAIRETRTLRASGLSLRAVASRLEENGFRTRTGRSFAAVQIRRMVEAA
jgi:DNA invertase Pin-like site-specific DNA recombinase